MQPGGGPLPSAVPGEVGWARPAPRRVWILAAIAIGTVVVAGVALWWALPRVRPGGYWFPVGGVLLILLVVWVSMWVIRIALWSSRRGRYANAGYPGRRHDPALRIARVRYARGEISREQYEQIVDGLRRPGPPS